LAARFGAVLIDMTIQLVLLAIMSLAAMVFSTNISPLENWVPWMLSVGIAAYGIMAFLILYAYFFFFEWLWQGQTPGKRMLRLRVMQTNGMPITYWHAFTRNIIRIADFLPVMYGVGAVVALLDDSNRRAGDLLAGTIVARERVDNPADKVLDIHTAVENFLNTNSAPLQPKNQSAQPVTEIQPEPTADAEAAAMLTRLDAQDYELARDFLERREKLQEDTRQRLANSLSSRLATKLGVEIPHPQVAEAFLGEVVERLRGRF
jgi:uncharacterized RDD family membrane protein YckC